MSGLAGIWWIIGGLAVATGLIRYSFLGLLRGRELSPRFRTALGFVPATVLPALVAPMVLYAPKADAVAPDQLAEPHRILAALAALAVGIATRSMMAAMGLGIAAFVTLRWLGL